MFKRFLIVISLLGAPAILVAQSSPTASRAGDLQIGAGLANANTDYVSRRVNGPSIYVDFDFYKHFGVEGEFRFLKDSPTNIYEKTYEIGGRYSRVYRGRYVPYVKLLYGRGVFNFAQNKVTTANLAYNMFAGGAGLDYRVLRYLNVRGDFEYQHWMGFPPNGLTPTVFTFGVAYHLPAGKLSQR
ncbi:outer membrane beta-barrel protein [Edaphobacter aggregans]|uniref:outer membrane beta-barrel protein n=1 Tax=Edaphobacter aggregans TaxID=570835 RepID=UPI0005531DE2|nr:outer membrane beta-barrel protein [Edaphobacter aggregans]